MKNTICIDRNLLSGIITTIISLILIFLIPEQISIKKSSVISAQTFPYLILYLMLFCSVGLLIKGFFLKNDDCFNFNIDNIKRFARPLLLSLIFSLYSLGVVTIGFMSSSILVSMAIMAFYKDFKLKSIVISVVVAVMISLFFEQILEVILP